MNSKPVVEIKNVSHFFGKGALRKQVLHDINLDIMPGEILILTGPSGSGKTTLLSLIGALRSVQQGSLKLFGVELGNAGSDARVHVRRQIGYIFQHHNLLGFLNARQNVQMALELDRGVSALAARARSGAMLDEVGLAEFTDRYPSNLSGGQKQRVAIARALVKHPGLVLADEPTASLDKKSGRDIVDILQRLAREQGCPIVLVTHDNRILDIADRIIHMEDGCLVANPGVAKIYFEI